MSTWEATPAERLARLCAVDSTSGQEDLLLPELRDGLRQLGARVRVQRVGPGRSNVLATWSHAPSPGDAGPRLLFTTHLDTVPPFLPPRHDGGALYGRGACDAKGQIVAQLGAIERLVASGEHRVAWLGVAGEETDGAGAEAAARWPEMPAELWAVVNGEPTGNRLTRAQKGCLHLALECSGVAGHSAVVDDAAPTGPTNALWRLHDWLGRLRDLPQRQHPIFGEETFNLGRLEGGEAANVVAAQARAELVARTVPGSTFAADTAAAAPDGGSVQTLSNDSPLELWVPDGWQSEVVAFGSDVPRLAALAPTRRVLQIGPGSIELAHGADEHLDLGELEAGIEVLCRLARELLANPPAPNTARPMEIAS